MQAEICGHFENGATVAAACAGVGIHPQTHYAWMQRGREAKSGKYREYADAVAFATERFELHHLTVLAQAGRVGIRETTEEFEERPDGSLKRVRVIRRVKQDPRYSSWLLARKFPERYSEKLLMENKVTVHDDRVHEMVFQFKDANGSVLPLPHGWDCQHGPAPCSFGCTAEAAGVNDAGAMADTAEDTPTDTTEDTAEDTDAG